MKPDFLKDAKFHYIKDTNKSYYGQIFSLYDNGKKKIKENFKDGQSTGLWICFYENEKKKQAIIFIDDKNCRCKSKV